MKNPINNSNILDYDSFVNEGFASPLASITNTPGMGNVSATSFADVVSEDEESADQDGVGKHLKMHERGHHDDSWMRPSGNYSNRNWLVPNFEMFQNERQSNTRFQVGQSVKCINPSHESCGLTGKIIAFEDNTIRWEADHTATGVGQGSKQYRCLAADLELV